MNRMLSKGTAFFATNAIDALKKFNRGCALPAFFRLALTQMAMKTTLPFSPTRLLPAALLAALLTSTGFANDATIVDVTITAAGADNQFRVSVTIEHADEGWDHYADRWDVLDESGTVIGSRTLHHPHVNEQPFTRSLTLTIPPGVAAVTIVASDSVHGDNSETRTIAVPGR